MTKDINAAETVQFSTVMLIFTPHQSRQNFLERNPEESIKSEVLQTCKNSCFGNF